MARTLNYSHANFTAFSALTRAVKVKMFYREGKIVKAYSRKISGKTKPTPLPPASNLHHLEDLDLNDLEIVKNKNQGGLSTSTFLKDKKTGNLFFCKQPGFDYTNSNAKEEWAANIGRKLNIPLNDVQIIPPGSGYDFASSGQAATIHSIVPGNPQPRLGFELFNFADPHIVTHGIAESPDLAKITAFDIFTGNPDRNSNNIFFSEKSGRFFGIDHGLIFQDKQAANNVKTTLDSLAHIGYSETLDKRQKQNIHVFFDTLEKLHAKPPEHYQTEYLKSVARSLGRSPHYSLENLKELHGVQNVLDFIEKNHKQVGTLLESKAKYL